MFMHLNQAVRYAVHALVFLARQQPGRLVACHEIDRGKDIPEPFLRKVLKELALAGILHSLRGPTGGYRLARKPKDISLLEVVETVDAPLRGEVSFEGKSAALENKLQAVCDRAAEHVREHFRKIKLSDLMNKR